jgi:hypothetical protein
MARSRSYCPPEPIPLGAQIMRMRMAHPSLRLAAWRAGRARWTGTLRPTDASFTYAIRIECRLGTRPRVYVTAPALVSRLEAEIPHLHRDGSLCLHLPDEFNPTMLVAETIVPWAALWLYHYEVWHATGEWLGGGAHPRLPGRRSHRFAGATPRTAFPTAGAL